MTRLNTHTHNLIYTMLLVYALTKAHPAITAIKLYLWCSPLMDASWTDWVILNMYWWILMKSPQRGDAAAVEHSKWCDQVKLSKHSEVPIDRPSAWSIAWGKTRMGINNPYCDHCLRNTHVMRVAHVLAQWWTYASIVGHIFYQKQDF
jgi:hypothetical protein